MDGGGRQPAVGRAQQPATSAISRSSPDLFVDELGALQHALKKETPFIEGDSVALSEVSKPSSFDIRRKPFVFLSVRNTS